MPDRTDRLRSCFQWDVRTWSRALPLWEEALGSKRSGLALALGEREGGLSLWLAGQGFHVLCTDLHPPGAEARSLHALHGVADRITYGAQDATDLHLQDGTFDVVIFKSMLGALSTRERQEQAIREMLRVLKPGGVLLFAENLAGTWPHRALRRRFVAWDHYWRYLRLPGDLALFRGTVAMRHGTTGLLANLGRSERQRDLLARIDRLLVPLVPEGWRYVLYGSARRPGHS